MRIEALIDRKAFWRFSMFDVFYRRKQGRSPIIFALILCICSCVCLLMHQIDGAVLLGSVLLAVGLGMPAAYFLSFCLSVRRQTALLGLSTPKKAYTLCLTDQQPGISVENECEHAEYYWEKINHVYRDKDATYLYITQERAFILPHACIEGTPDLLWSLVAKRVAPERMTVLR